MSFLVVHDISESNPYAILKVTKDSTTQDVIKMALEKTGKLHKSDEFVLVEEVEDSSQQASQRMVGMEEIPLSLREEWSSHGKFVLKKVAADPSWRARLCGSERDRKHSMMIKTDSLDVFDEVDSSGKDDCRDDFLLCVFNVSPTVAHTMLWCSKASTTREVIRLALERGRRGDLEPINFVLVEEQEVREGKGKKGRRVERRVLSPEENVYLVQSSWREGGKLTLQERDRAALRRLGLDIHPSIRETQSDPVASPRQRRRNNLVRPWLW